MNLQRREFLEGLAISSMAPSIGNSAFEQRAKSDFDLQKGLVYLQTGSLGPTPRVVQEAVRACSAKLETNPALMAYGELEREMEFVRSDCAGLLNCSVEEVSMTRSTTESMNSLASGILFQKGDRILTSDQEHPGGRVCWDYVSRRFGVELDIVQIPDHINDPLQILDLFRRRISNKTRVLSVSHVLSSTGLRMPVAKLCELAREAGAISVIDGAQAVGAIKVDIGKLGCDAYASSGHKWMLGPKGTGILYISRTAQKLIEPISLQSGRNVYSASSGVSNIPEILGLRRSVRFLVEKGIDKIESYNLGLRNRLAAVLAEIKGLEVMSPALAELQAPMLSFRLPNAVDSGKLKALLLDKYRIEVKHVPGNWFNGLRISTHLFNTESDLRALSIALNRELS